MTLFSIAVLLSGSGSNLQALLDAQDAGSLGAKVGLVVSDRADPMACSAHWGELSRPLSSRCRAWPARARRAMPCVRIGSGSCWVC